MSDRVFERYNEHHYNFLKNCAENGKIDEWNAQYTHKNYQIGAILIDADLSGLCLQSVDLTGADLTNAVLCGVYLRGVDMSGSRMTGADMTEADLTGADLRGVHMYHVDLTDADLTGARIGGSLCWGKYRDRLGRTHA